MANGVESQYVVDLRGRVHGVAGLRVPLEDQ